MSFRESREGGVYIERRPFAWRDEGEELAAWVGGVYYPEVTGDGVAVGDPSHIDVPTPYGVVRAEVGDWLVREIRCGVRKAGG